MRKTLNPMRKTSNERFKEYADVYYIHQAGIVCHTVFGLYEFALYNMKLCVHARYFLLYLFTSPLLPTSCSPQIHRKSFLYQCALHLGFHYTHPITYFTTFIPGNQFLAQFIDGLRINQKKPM